MCTLVVVVPSAELDELDRDSDGIWKDQSGSINIEAWNLEICDECHGIDRDKQAHVGQFGHYDHSPAARASPFTHTGVYMGLNEIEEPLTGLMSPCVFLSFLLSGRGLVSLPKPAPSIGTPFPSLTFLNVKHERSLCYAYAGVGFGPPSFSCSFQIDPGVHIIT